MNASTHEISVPTYTRPVLVQATEPHPGLHVYPTPDEIADPGDPYTWRLGHHSGHVIAKFEQRSQAEDAARALGDIGDWIRPAAEVRRDVDPEDVFDALAQFPCVFIKQQAT
ncbi:hypothetical protein OG209_05490 [Streptomyces sp. NBC_01383]|uniref:hypothetical protein n=1 Tax=Streptomyces sp. NBC_01383 TaxID=2903846 RepID=UPI00324518CD